MVNDNKKDTPIITSPQMDIPPQDEPQVPNTLNTKSETNSSLVQTTPTISEPSSAKDNLGSPALPNVAINSPVNTKSEVNIEGEVESGASALETSIKEHKVAAQIIEKKQSNQEVKSSVTLNTPFTPINNTQSAPEIKKPELSKPEVMATPVPEVKSDNAGGIVRGKTSLFPVFMGIMILITIIILAGVGYLYFRNANLKREIQNSVVDVITPVEPPFTAEQIQIVDGNVVDVRPFGKSKVLVDKSNYVETGIAGFAKVKVSPDSSLICFESYPPSPQPALFFSEINGNGVTKIADNAKDCIFLPDSKRIIYSDFANVTNKADIYLYNSVSKEIVNLSKDYEGVTDGHFVIEGISEDGMTIDCRYYDIEIDYNDQTAKNCQISLTAIDTALSD